MSPRAAARLESLGFTDVSDFVPGKAAWLASGLQTEGTSASVPRAGQAARKDIPTCQMADRLSGVASAVRAAGADMCVVVNGDGIVLGRLRRPALESADDVTAEAAMEPGPTTVRPDEALEPLIDRMQARSTAAVIVSTLDGRFVGALYRSDAEACLERHRQTRA